MTLTRRTLLCRRAPVSARRHSPHTPNRPAWPTRPLRIIIPTAPGGSPDMVARMLGNKLTERLGQPVVVESIVQGVGLVGNQMVSRAAPDGSTFAMLTGGFSTQAARDEVAALRSGAGLLVRDHGRHLSDVPAGGPQFADCELSRLPRACEARARKAQHRDHRQWQRVSPARQVDRKPGGHPVGRDSVPRLGRSLH